MELPLDFIKQTQAVLGEEWDDFLLSLQEEPLVSIRLNPKKEAKGILPYELGAEQQVGWAKEGFYLEKRPKFTLDPLFHAGTYYVQEASSMYLGTIIREQVNVPSRVLDLCAAPGGKSTDLLGSLPEESLLVANEVIRSRANILSENLIKWGYPNTIVTNNDPSAFKKLKYTFDVIVADVPCSGEGMFRKDPNAIREWSPGNVALCAERQRRIVADIWNSLAHNGLFVYSTCTYNRQENEDNINWICNELGAEIVVQPRRFFPHTSKGEGFFIAAVRKTYGKKEPLPPPSPQGEGASKKKKKESPSLVERDLGRGLLSTLHSSEDYTVFMRKNELTAFLKEYISDYQCIDKQLNILHAGIPLGEQKGKDIVPAHALAMSIALNKDSFPRWEVDFPTALAYLRRESFHSLPDDLPTGYIILYYQNIPLGFVKNIGSRANNLYPQAWKINYSKFQI